MVYRDIYRLYSSKKERKKDIAHHMRVLSAMDAALKNSTPEDRKKYLTGGYVIKEAQAIVRREFPTNNDFVHPMIQFKTGSLTATRVIASGVVEMSNGSSINIPAYPLSGTRIIEHINNSLFYITDPQWASVPDNTLTVFDANLFLDACRRRTVYTNRPGLKYKLFDVPIHDQDDAQPLLKSLVAKDNSNLYELCGEAQSAAYHIENNSTVILVGPAMVQGAFLKGFFLKEEPCEITALYYDFTTNGYNSVRYQNNVV